MRKTYFGNSLDQPGVYQPLVMYLQQTLPRLEFTRTIKNLKKINKGTYDINLPKLKLRDVLDTNSINDFIKIQIYTTFVPNPSWDEIAPRLKMFRNSILLQENSENWYKPQWLMYLSFVAYKHYLNKSDFDVIRKGINLCFEYYPGPFDKNRTLMNYHLIFEANPKPLKVSDFYNFMKKHFSLQLLQCIGY